MVDLNAHEAGNGGQSQGKPTARAVLFYSEGEERIANELKLNLSIQVSPRTVGKYLRDGPVHKPDPKQRWLTFVRNHAKVIAAADFFVVITATFRTLYVFVVIEIGSRMILHQT